MSDVFIRKLTNCVAKDGVGGGGIEANEGWRADPLSKQDNNNFEVKTLII